MGIYRQRDLKNVKERVLRKGIINKNYTGHFKCAL